MISTFINAAQVYSPKQQDMNNFEQELFLCGEDFPEQNENDIFLKIWIRFTGC